MLDMFGTVVSERFVCAVERRIIGKLGDTSRVVKDIRAGDVAG